MSQIENDDESSKKKRSGVDEDIAKHLQGMRRAPNLSHLPDEEKHKIAKESLAHCANILMATYISLGMGGEAKLGMIDGVSGLKFLLTFKAYAHGEEDDISKNL